jgi:hypothetical protein
MSEQFALASFGGKIATGLRDVTSDLSALDSQGWWAVAITFEGQPLCARFDDVREGSTPVTDWVGPPRSSWTTSLDHFAYVKAVEQVRELIGVAADDARLLLDRDGGLDGARGQAARMALYLFERDAGVATLRGG